VNELDTKFLNDAYSDVIITNGYKVTYILYSSKSPFYKIIENNEKKTITIYISKFTNKLLLLNILKLSIIDTLYIIWKNIDTNKLVQIEDVNSYKQCLLKKFFQIPKSISKNIFAWSSGEKVKNRIFAYKYDSNSCYIDSLLIVLFFSWSNYWIDHILNTDVDKITYERYLLTGTEFTNIEDLKQNTLNIQKAITLDAEKIKHNNFDAHSSLITRKKNTEQSYNDLTCSLLRTYIKNMLPEIHHEVTGWIKYNTDAVYEVFAKLFDMKLSSTVCINKFNEAEDKYECSESTNSSPFFDVSEFMLKPMIDKKGDSYKTIKWKDYKEPVLVLLNTGAPRIKKFDSMEPEENFIQINGKKHTSKIQKNRVLGETILNKRYKLCGVISLIGVKAHQEGGAHYVSYFSNGTNYYYYDDLTGSAKLIDELPRSGVWEESYENMPIMFFYAKVVINETTDNLVISVKEKENQYYVFVELLDKDDHNVKDQLLKLSPITTFTTDDLYVWHFEAPKETNTLINILKKI
jgi:hypothetical protein